MNSTLLIFVLVLIYMSIWYVVGLALKRNDVADIAWGLGFVLIAWLSWFIGARNEVSFIVNCLVTIWGLRLSWHIFQRNVKRDEDYRYLEWRNTWKNFYIRSYLQIFILQGILMYIITIPVWVVNLSYIVSFQVWGLIGLLVWAVGFYFESVGDSQLKEFISNPVNKGKLMTSGLWKYTRHPNYFGEITQWWGIFVLVLGATGNMLLLIGPLTITFFILFVSGVPLLEKKYVGRSDWEVYKARTSMIIPWFIRN